MDPLYKVQNSECRVEEEYPAPDIFGLSFKSERPILGNQPKPQSVANEFT